MLDTIVDNIPSLLLYLAVFTISTAAVFCGLNCLAKKKKPLGALLVAIGLLLPPIMAGIRYGVGNDYFSYLSMHNNASAGRPLYFRSIEPVSAFLIWVSGVLHCSFLMFFSFSLITNTCFFFAYKNMLRNDNKKIALAYLITLCLHFSTSLNAIRSMVVVAMLALAFSFILHERTAKRVAMALSLIVVAALFHLSALIAIVFIPAFWVIFRRNSKNHAISITITWAVYVLISALMPVIFSVARLFVPLGDYGRYLDKVGLTFSIPLANLLLLVPIVTAGLFLYFNKKERADSTTAILLCSLFYIPMSIAVGWVTYADGLSRITFIFDPLIIALMSFIPVAPKKVPAVWKAVLATATILVTGMMFIRNVNWSGVLPYRTVFQRNDAPTIEMNDDTTSSEDAKAIIIIDQGEAGDASEN